MTPVSRAPSPAAGPRLGTVSPVRRVLAAGSACSMQEPHWGRRSGAQLGRQQPRARSTASGTRPGEGCHPAACRWGPEPSRRCRTGDQRPRAPAHGRPPPCRAPCDSRRAAPTRAGKLRRHRVHRPPRPAHLPPPRAAWCAWAPYLFQRAVGDAAARQAQAAQVPLQGPEEPREAGAVGRPREGVAQLAPTAAPEDRVRHVGLNQGRDAGRVLRVVDPRIRRLSKQGGQ